MDLNQVMKLAQDPNVQSLLKNLFNQFKSQNGGQANLQGLVDQMQQAGLGDQVNSWVGKGPNQEISAQQVQQVLGTGTLDQLAAQSGMSPETAADDIAKVLPEIVNKATPDGKVPEPKPNANMDEMLQQLLGSLAKPKA